MNVDLQVITHPCLRCGRETLANMPPIGFSETLLCHRCDTWLRNEAELRATESRLRRMILFGLIQAVVVALAVFAMSSSVTGQDRRRLPDGPTPLASEEVVSVRSHGALGDISQQINVTAEFAAAFAEARQRGVPVYIPPGLGTGSQAAYIVVGLPLQTDDRIIAAPGAVIRSLDPPNDVIFTATGDVQRVHVRGGTWRNCRAVIEQTGSQQALSYSTFRDMFVRDCVAGFKFDSLMLTTFERVRFSYNPIETCFDFTGAGFVNHNTFRECFFVASVVTTGVRFRLYGVNNPRLDNRFERCVFEDLVGRPVWVEDEVHGLTFVGCWFERNGLPTWIEPPAGRSADVSFVDCFWNSGPNPWQTQARIQTRGDTAVTIRGGSWRERPEPDWTLIEVGGTSSRQVVIDGLRRVSGVGPLFTHFGGSVQPVGVR